MSNQNQNQNQARTQRAQKNAQQELQDQRKFGLAPLAKDAITGQTINPHIPTSISNVPWYYGSGVETLVHQQKQKPDQKNESASSSSSSSELFCVKCGKSGHVAKNCLSGIKIKNVVAPTTNEIQEKDKKLKKKRRQREQEQEQEEKEEEEQEKPILLSPDPLMTMIAQEIEFPSSLSSFQEEQEEQDSENKKTSHCCWEGAAVTSTLDENNNNDDDNIIGHEQEEQEEKQPKQQQRKTIEQLATTASALGTGSNEDMKHALPKYMLALESSNQNQNQNTTNSTSSGIHYDRVSRTLRVDSENGTNALLASSDVLMSYTGDQSRTENAKKIDPLAAMRNITGSSGKK